MISFSCPNCKSKQQRADAEAGTKILCPSCHRKLLIPTPRRVSDPTLAGELHLEPADLPLRRDLVPVPPPRPAPPVATLSAPTPGGPPLRCTCPHCQGTLWVEPQQAGSRLPCGHCGLPVEIPWPKAVLHEEVPLPPVAPVPVPVPSPAPLPGPASHPAPVIIMHHEGDGARHVEQPRPATIGSVLTGALLGAVICALLLLAGSAGFSIYLMYANTQQATEKESSKLRNQIASIKAQLEVLAVAADGARARRDKQATLALLEQGAVLFEEQAEAQDRLAALLTGHEHDDLVRAVHDSRKEAQAFRVFAAQLRAQP